MLESDGESKHQTPLKRVDDFDCVLAELARREPLDAPEKIAYLGSGLFGVIVEKENNRFEIHRKIAVEDPINPPAWRKELRGLYKR